MIPKKDDIALFSDSIPRNWNTEEIGRQVQGGRIHVKAFPGFKSTQLYYYITLTLENIVMVRPSYVLALTIS